MHFCSFWNLNIFRFFWNCLNFQNLFIFITGACLLKQLVKAGCIFNFFFKFFSFFSHFSEFFKFFSTFPIFDEFFNFFQGQDAFCNGGMPFLQFFNFCIFPIFQIFLIFLTFLTLLEFFDFLQGRMPFRTLF